MNKSNFFIGQPIFSQLLKLIPKDIIAKIVLEHKADHYCKRFNTYDHLVSLLYSIFNDCQSLREVVSGMLASEQRLLHLGVKYPPRKSTLSDANNRRSASVFEDIYYSLFKRYACFLPDSRHRRLYMVDSTTISLFHEVLRTGGLSPANGKRKGGIKVHTMLRSDQDIPCFIRFSQAAASDSPFLKEVSAPSSSIILFDRGYHDLSSFQRLTDKKITWITRLRKSFTIEVCQDNIVNASQRHIISDQLVQVGKKAGHKILARLITYRDGASNRIYEFLTNDLKRAPQTIAGLYRKRWQIELLFKRMKQNYPLRYFLDDTENAIKIQIWCAMIADFIVNLIKKTTTKKWAFSNLRSLIRIHLFTYIDLKAFLNASEKALLKAFRPENNFNLQLFKT